MTKARKITFTVAGIAAVALVAAGFLIIGQEAGIASLTGVVGTSLFLLAGWYGLKIAGASMEGKKPGVWRGLAATLFFLLKFPFILWAMTFSKGLGPSGPAWFLAGLALVYSALVSWGLTADQTPG